MQHDIWAQKNVNLPFTSQMTQYTTSCWTEEEVQMTSCGGHFSLPKNMGGSNLKLLNHCKCGPINIVPCCDHVTFWTKVGNVIQSHISMVLCKGTKHLYPKAEQILCFDMLYSHVVSEMQVFSWRKGRLGWSYLYGLPGINNFRSKTSSPVSAKGYGKSQC